MGGPSARDRPRAPPGRPHEVSGNAHPRWMVTAPDYRGTESGLQAGSHFSPLPRPVRIGSFCSPLR
jgi:hypothetical protein